MILLDTHALVWLSEGLSALGKKARKIADEGLAEDTLAVSAISFWEIALLHQKERITLTQDVSAWRKQLLEMGLQELPVDGEIGIAATQLVNFHADPADRFITASAIFFGASLLTADTRILQWTGNVQWKNDPPAATVT